MQYDDEFIQEISEGVDLVEYVSNQISLVKRGDKYFGSCPLHVDLTPSFSITPEVNQFYCFSCGVGGGIIKYLLEYEKLGFDEAVAKASALANIDLSTMCQSETVKINRKLKKMQTQRGSFVHQIFDEQTYSKFSIEQIPEWLEEGISPNTLSEFDIRVDNKSNRIVYPVRDMDGNLINVKGRTRFKDYKKMGISKYINYYPVGGVDYFQSLEKTFPYIKQTNEFLIFESIKSVMKLWSNEIKNSTSAEKHTLTDEQIKLIIQTQTDAVFCYDSDVSYNEKEVKRNLETLKRFTNVYITTDPHNLLGGKEARNAPIDLGIDIWHELYANKIRIK